MVLAYINEPNIINIVYNMIFFILKLNIIKAMYPYIKSPHALGAVEDVMT